MHAPQHPTIATDYRPDIDGLRAVAVILVVIFHAFPEAMPGGFIGVDIFFVISGFLITGIITRELGQQRFSLLGFYQRRIRRIFPALIVVLGSILVTGWLWMLPEAYAQLSADVVASAAFIANFALLWQSGYFDIESARKPLLHLWSLGIEEQFYLFWPLILLLAARLRFSLLTVALAIGLTSFAFNVAMIGSNPVATFYLPLTRVWELLAGAALACSWSRVSQTSAASNWRAALGLALMVTAAATLDTRSSFPGWWAIFPVAGASLLLSAPAAWFARFGLASGPLVWIGLISYPLYLWHWPLFVFFGIIKFAPLTLLERGLIVGLSFALAWLTYRVIELPFRSGKLGPLKVASLCAGMVLIAVSGAAVVQGRGFDFRLPPEIRQLASVPTGATQWRVHECLLDLSQETTFADTCIDNPPRRPLILVWGDSTAGALIPGLRKAQQSHGFGIAQYTSSSCIPALHIDVPGNPNCRMINDKILSIAQATKPDIILLHSTWDRYIDGVAQTVLELKRTTGARVVVLGSAPWWKRGLPNEVLRHFMLHQRLISERSTRAEPDGSSALRARLVPIGAEYISAWNAMCNADGCLARLGDSAKDISASDQVHLTEAGSIFLVRSILNEMLHPKQ